LLTNRDLADLASLKTITGGGAALNSAVIRAVRDECAYRGAGFGQRHDEVSAL